MSVNMRMHYADDAPSEPVYVTPVFTYYGHAYAARCGARSKHGLNVTSNREAVDCPKCAA